MKLKKILAAIDGSEASYMALDFAVSLAKKYSASLTILAVVEPLSPTPSPTIPPGVVEPYMNEVKTYYKGILEKAMERAAEGNKRLDVNTILLHGRAWEKIVGECRNGGYDLLVMGSRGLGGIKGFILGSVSKRAVEEAPCPVLIVKSAAGQDSQAAHEDA
jgi:nucleotide-binding universal stress UspA family protein